MLTIINNMETSMIFFAFTNSFHECRNHHYGYYY